jgi:hypothetical protein
MNEYTPDQMEHRAITDDLSTGQYRFMQVNEEAARREKARLFDALAAAVARKNGRDWAIYHGIGTPVVIYLRGSGEIVHGATLAEAVAKAMEAEGER